MAGAVGKCACHRPSLVLVRPCAVHRITTFAIPEPGEGQPNRLQEQGALRNAAISARKRVSQNAAHGLRLTLRQMCEKRWGALSEEQQDAAKQLGWGARSWDTGDLVPCR